MTNVAIKTKQPSKTTLARSIFRSVMNDDTIVQAEKRKVALLRFKTEAQITDKAAQTYYRICLDMSTGKDPHEGRKKANKARSVLLKGQQEVVEEKPPVDLSKRWLVGSDRENLVGSFESRAKAQDFAKVNSMKWFDSQK